MFRFHTTEDEQGGGGGKELERWGEAGNIGRGCPMEGTAP